MLEIIEDGDMLSALHHGADVTINSAASEGEILFKTIVSSHQSCPGRWRLMQVAQTLILFFGGSYKYPCDFFVIDPLLSFAPLGYY